MSHGCPGPLGAVVPGGAAGPAGAAGRLNGMSTSRKSPDHQPRRQPIRPSAKSPRAPIPSAIFISGHELNLVPRLGGAVFGVATVTVPGAAHPTPSGMVVPPSAAAFGSVGARKRSPDACVTAPPSSATALTAPSAAAAVEDETARSGLESVPNPSAVTPAIGSPDSSAQPEKPSPPVAKVTANNPCI